MIYVMNMVKVRIIYTNEYFLVTNVKKKEGYPCDNPQSQPKN